MSSAFQEDKRARSFGSRLILLSGRDIEDAARLMTRLAESTEAEVVGTAPSGRPKVVTRQALINAARHELADRQRRRQFLPEEMFGEPAWEMLLLLYVEQQGTRLNVARLSANLGLAGTTTLRWLVYLEENQLIQREPNPIDQRTAFLKLTVKGVEALDMYFSEAALRAA